jgi:hypothetical protein
VEEPPDPRAVALRHAPTLAVLASLAALLDLALNRVAVRAAYELAEPATVLAWMRFGALPRNLAGISGVVALLAALFAYLRMPGFAPLYIRLPVAAFAGVLMPTLTLAIALPRERMSPHLVLFGMFATSVLVTLFAASALRYRNRWLRWGLIAALASAVQALIVVSIASVRATIQGGFGGPIAWICRHGGEIAWLLVPLIVAPAVLSGSSRTGGDRAALFSGALAALAVIAVAIAG